MVTQRQVLKTDKKEDSHGDDSCDRPGEDGFRVGGSGRDVADRGTATVEPTAARAVFR
jgi:hypothetical protein